MTRFTSVPGMTHSGDNIRYERKGVYGEDGQLLYTRKVVAPGYDVGFDTGDGLHWNGHPVEVVNHDWDEANDRNEVTYRVQEDGGSRYREIAVQYERDNDGRVVLARSREKH